MKELRATQEQLVQAERFRALGEITASVAQHLGDSLAMIVGFAQILVKIAPAESGMKPQLEQIGDMAFGCHEIVKNLAHFPWNPASARVQTQLNVICEEMLAGLAYQADLSHIVVERRLDGLAGELQLAAARRLGELRLPDADDRGAVAQGAAHAPVRASGRPITAVPDT